MAVPTELELWEGQTYSLTLPMPGGMAPYTVDRYTMPSGLFPATSGTDYKPLDSMGGSVPGGTAKIVAKVDGAAEGDETFEYTYYVSWYGDTGYGGMGTYYTLNVWSITLHDAMNDAGTSSPDATTGTPGFDKLAGADGNDTLSGGAGNDTLMGGANSDELAGGKGNDKLTGNTGADQFTFAQWGPANADTITDFVPGKDSIALNASMFTQLVPTLAGGLKAANFHLGTEAAGSHQYVLYDPASGNLYYDPDGTGPQEQKLVATLTGSPDNLSEADFRVS